MNWVSFGVQDFDLKVQIVIGWVQFYEIVVDVVVYLCVVGLDVFNFDLMYGLLYQSEVSIVDMVIKMFLFNLGCIVFFGYVYVLWMCKY